MRAPNYYRRRAEELRHKAESVTDPALRDQLKIVAKEYEDMTDTAEAVLRLDHPQ